LGACAGTVVGVVPHTGPPGSRRPNSNGEDGVAPRGATAARDADGKYGCV